MVPRHYRHWRCTYVSGVPAVRTCKPRHLKALMLVPSSVGSLHLLHRQLKYLVAIRCSLRAWVPQSACVYIVEMCSPLHLKIKLIRVLHLRILIMDYDKIWY